MCVRPQNEVFRSMLSKVRIEVDRNTDARDRNITTRHWRVVNILSSLFTESYNHQATKPPPAKLARAKNQSRVDRTGHLTQFTQLLSRVPAEAVPANSIRETEHALAPDQLRSATTQSVGQRRSVRFDSSV